MLQQLSVAQNLRIACNCWSFVTTTASSGAVLTSRIKAFGKPFWKLNESIDSRISSSVLSDFCLRHKSYVWSYEFGRSALVEASSKPPELLTNLSKLHFLSFLYETASWRCFWRKTLLVVTFSYFCYYQTWKSQPDAPHCQNSIARKSLIAVHSDLGSICILLFYGNHDKLCGCR